MLPVSVCVSEGASGGRHTDMRHWRRDGSLFNSDTRVSSRNYTFKRLLVDYGDEGGFLANAKITTVNIQVKQKESDEAALNLK